MVLILFCIFVAQNPGIWFFPCHINLHAVSSMASRFIEAPDLSQARPDVPGACTGVRKKQGLGLSRKLRERARCAVRAGVDRYV